MSRASKLICLLSIGALFTLAYSGCKEEKKDEPQTSGAQKSVSDTFIDNLVATEFINYDIAIGGGGRLTYRTLTFKSDKTWTSDAMLRLAEDPFDCVESGTWQLEPQGNYEAQRGNVLIMMNATDCPGRTEPSKWKVDIRLQGKAGRPEIVEL